MAPESLRQRLVRWRLEELLIKYSGLRLTSAPRGWVKIAGALAFVAEGPRKERIGDEYQIELWVPADFPQRVPSVRETGGRIPPDFHKLDDGALCLGAPTRLRLMLTESPSILRFVERCVVPYLYGYSYFERHGALPFGELKHGEEGIREDFASLFGSDGEDNVRKFVRLTAMRKRHANKQPCPCGSQRRLGQCHHRRVNMLRHRLGRQWFRIWYAALRKDQSSGSVPKRANHSHSRGGPTDGTGSPARSRLEQRSLMPPLVALPMQFEFGRWEQSRPRWQAAEGRNPEQNAGC